MVEYFLVLLTIKQLLCILLLSFYPYFSAREKYQKRPSHCKIRHDGFLFCNYYSNAKTFKVLLSSGMAVCDRNVGAGSARPGDCVECFVSLVQFLPLTRCRVFYFYLSILYFVAQSTKRPSHRKIRHDGFLFCNYYSNAKAFKVLLSSGMVVCDRNVRAGSARPGDMFCG